jgi:hypothetical protein
VKLRRHYLEAFHRAEHRDSGSDDSIAVEERRTDEAERDDYLLEISVCIAPLLLHDEREECENAAFAAVICAEDEDQVFDADDENQSPDDERENAVDVLWRGGEPILRLEALTEGVERTRPDVAVDDTKGYKSQLSESFPGGARLGMIADVRVPGYGVRSTPSKQ